MILDNAVLRIQNSGERVKLSGTDRMLEQLDKLLRTGRQVL